MQAPPTLKAVATKFMLSIAAHDGGALNHLCSLIGQSNSNALSNSFKMSLLNPGSGTMPSNQPLSTLLRDSRAISNYSSSKKSLMDDGAKLQTMIETLVNTKSHAAFTKALNTLIFLSASSAAIYGHGQIAGSLLVADRLLLPTMTLVTDVFQLFLSNFTTTTVTETIENVNNERSNESGRTQRQRIKSTLSLQQTKLQSATHIIIAFIVVAGLLVMAFLLFKHNQSSFTSLQNQKQHQQQKQQTQKSKTDFSSGPHQSFQRL